MFNLSMKHNKKTDTGGRAFLSMAPKSVRQASAVFCHSYRSYLDWSRQTQTWMSKHSPLLWRPWRLLPIFQSTLVLYVQNKKSQYILLKLTNGGLIYLLSTSWKSAFDWLKYDTLKLKITNGKTVTIYFLYSTNFSLLLYRSSWKIFTYVV